MINVEPNYTIAPHITQFKTDFVELDTNTVNSTTKERSMGTQAWAVCLTEIILNANMNGLSVYKHFVAWLLPVLGSVSFNYALFALAVHVRPIFLKMSLPSVLLMIL